MAYEARLLKTCNPMVNGMLDPHHICGTILYAGTLQVHIANRDIIFEGEKHSAQSVEQDIVRPVPTGLRQVASHQSPDDMWKLFYQKHHARSK